MARWYHAAVWQATRNPWQEPEPPAITDEEYAKHKEKYKGEGYKKLVLEQIVVVTARPPSPPIAPFDFAGHWFVGMGEILLNGNLRGGARELLWAYGGSLLFGAALGGIEDLAGSSGALDDASQAAFKAANDGVEDFQIPLKHLPGAGGSWSKFAPGVDAKAAIRDALVSPNAQFLPNAETPNSLVVVTDLGRVVGSNGQTAVKIVFDKAGNIWTAYPVNPR